MTDSATPNHPPDTLPAPPASRIAGRSPRAVAVFLAVTVLVIAADLYLKHWAFENVAGVPVVLTGQVVDEHQAFWAQYPHEPVVIVPEVLNLQLTTNTGAVFGLGKGGRLVFILVSVLATAIILVMFYRSRANAWLLHMALAMILAGALGNLYDRVVYSAVRDMLHMLPGTRLWPWIFNLADAALMVGVGLVLVLTFVSDRKQPEKQASASPA